MAQVSNNQTITGTVDLDNYHRLTIGGLVGIGVEWKRLAISAEANRDLSTYLNVPPIPGFDDVKPKFTWYGFNVSYQFRNF